MKEHTKKAVPVLRHQDGGVEMGAASRQATTSTHNDTTTIPEGQGFRVADFLSPGMAYAVPLRDLVSLTGWNERNVRRQIERERRAGTLIVSDNQHGYWLADDPAEVARFTRSMRHRAHRILEVVRTVEGSAGIG